VNAGLAPADHSTEIEDWLRAVAHLSEGARPQAAPPLQSGAHLHGDRFSVGALLGRGGMGAVYEVRDLERQVDLALKTPLDRRPERVLHLKNEFRASRDLVHPNLVQLDELFESDGLWFFTMERLRGTPFTTFVRPGGSLDPDRARRALRGLVGGLSALHAAGKVHRDVKPSNALVESGGRVVLLDFGLVGGTERVSQERTARAGTAVYMAPEQGCGAGGPPADWYSVGVVLYQSLTGVLPFAGSGPDVLARKRAETPPAPSTMAPGVPPDLEQLCLDLLQTSPGRRPGGDEISRRLGGPRTTAAPSAPRALVGRRRELGLLREALATAERAGPVTVLIRGAPGVGKTTLVETFLGRLAEPVTVLSGRCCAREFIPLRALDGVVDSLACRLARLDDAALRGLLPSNSAALAELFPVLTRSFRPRASPAKRSRPSPSKTRRPALGALRKLLAGLARKSTLVVAIDDLQWADSDSLGALEDLFRGSLFKNVVLILAARPNAEVPKLSGRRVVLELGAWSPG
jgi:serine/threonine protein kinase